LIAGIFSPATAKDKTGTSLDLREAQIIAHTLEKVHMHVPESSVLRYAPRVKFHRLHGRKVCQHVLSHGTLWRGKTMNIRWLSGVPLPVWRELKERAPQGLYLGTFAPLSLSKRAVDRNRMRRRIREALRIVLKEEQEFPAAQLLLSPRSSSLSCAFADLDRDVRVFLSSLRACLRNHPKKGAAS